MTTLNRLAALLLLCAHAAGGDPADDLVTTLVASPSAMVDAKRLLASKDVDPWVVADRLCALDRSDLARMIAEACDAPQSAALGSYVSTQRPYDARVVVRCLGDARVARLRDNPRRAISIVDGAIPRAQGVLQIELLHERALALRDAGDPTYVAAQLASAEAAQRIGWARMVRVSLKDLVAVHFGCLSDNERYLVTAASLRRVQQGLHESQVAIVADDLAGYSVAVVVSPDDVRYVVLGSAASIAASCQELRNRDFAEMNTATLARLVLDNLHISASAREVRVEARGTFVAVPLAALDSTRRWTYKPVTLIDRVFGDNRCGRGIAVVAGDLGENAMDNDDVVIAHVKSSDELKTKLSKNNDGWCAVQFGGNIVGGKVQLAEDVALGQRELVLMRLRTDLLVFAGEGAQAFAPVAPIDVMPQRQALLEGDPTEQTALEDLARRAKTWDIGPQFLVCETSPRVLVSLWATDPAARAAFMTSFYAAWRKGTRAKDALWVAQECMRKSAEWKSPRYWAGWQLWDATE